MRPRAVHALKFSIVGLFVAAIASSSLLARPEDGAGPTPMADRDASHEGARDGMRDGPRDGSQPREGREGPSTRPQGRGAGGGDRGWAGLGFGRRGPNDVAPPSADEWKEIDQFMRENSPARRALYQQIETQLGLKDNVTQAVRKRIAGRYKDLQTMKERNNDMYDFAFKQVKLEDDALGTLIQIRKSGETPELLGQLKAQMHAFIENSLSERQARLSRLRDMLTREETNLGRDRADVAKLEATQRTRFENDMKKMLEFTVDGDDATTRTAEK